MFGGRQRNGQFYGLYVAAMGPWKFLAVLVTSLAMFQYSSSALLHNTTSSQFLPLISKMSNRPDLESMRSLVVSINGSILSFLECSETRKTAYVKCASRLKMDEKRETFFEFSEQSVVSNLYWAIHSIEGAIQEKWDSNSKLNKAETMLQVPALLDEQGSTAGISNAYLVCVSYFYLSLVRKLQRDDLQVALHFLQALLVSPRLVRAELMPADHMFPPQLRGQDEAMLARKYKDWLIYYQVMLYEHNKKGEYDRKLPLHSLRSHETTTSFEDNLDSGEARKLLSSNIKCLQDMLNDSDSDMSASSDLQETMEGNDDGDDSDKLITISYSCWNNHDHVHDEEVELFHHMNIASTSSTCNQSARKKNRSYHGHKKVSRSVCLNHEYSSQSEIQQVLDKAISKLYFSEGSSGKCHEDYFTEVKIIYETLNRKAGARYELLKDTLLDQLLNAISTSKEDGVVRASVSILTSIVSENKSVIEDIKKKGLQLCDLATALKRNVPEAATLIYLINPSPSEIKTLEVLPTLVEVVCTYNMNRLPASLQLTPPTASLMIIEVLVTAFDYQTNNLHLAAINSPRVLCALVHVAKKDNVEEFISLATILVKCMQFDGQSRKYISEFTPMGPFICLLQTNKKRAKLLALEFFHEILRIPRSSAISLLQRMQNEGSINEIVDALMQFIQQLEPDYQLLAANLLLQLDAALDEPTGCSRVMLRDEAIKVLLKSVASEESPNGQLLSTFILSNLGGTFTWTGEPYTVAWLVRKTGLSSWTHRNMIRNFDWLDQSLVESTETDIWCSKIARNIIHSGNHVFHALAKGLKSNIRRVAMDSLTAIAWLGCEIRKSPNSVKYGACEILLSGVEQFLHPGLELEQRLLACLCIYNYTSGKGMQKVIHFSEGVRESLRRFSNVTWMAEELHKVADYILPNKSRISCVHTQIVEASHSGSGAVNSLIYYKGLLCSGYSDGSIKVWDIKKQSAKLVWNIKEHRKAVTCFSLFEPGESLLSGSADKTIRVWQMVQGKLECTEVIATKNPIQKLDSYGDMIFVKTQGHSMKVFDSSRKLKDICKSKKVKCMKMFQGKIYVGCSDSSIQELAITHNREREIKAPTRSWMMLNRAVNSIAVYKDWLYSATSIVEGSNVKEWRRHREPQMCIRAERRANVVAMGVVEDFIYLNYSSTPSILQIWLRGTGQKVGRLSAGSKITSILTANDVILCGTETGLIKGWIPL